jgi:signal transduction histidine kinase/CheY-like chemotaxis protein
LPVLIEEAFIHDEEGKITGIHSTLQDITERKKVEEAMVALQEQFRQSQKMEAVGRLAGGIAHDFNNLLTVIRGYTQLSLLELKEGDPLRRNIEEIQKATERGADLTSQLLAFSRRRVMETKTLDVNALLKEMDKMLRRVIGEDIDLHYRLADDLGKVKAHPGQIGQMIINIAVNARDAMPKGGKLTIETADVKFDEISDHTYGDRITGPYVMLSVNDTGCGMTSEIKDHIFEPFFTTKEKGKGTGLGLSTVYGIVKHSGGIIHVYSKPGEGTTFKIYLPRADELSDEVGKKITGIEIPRGNETILLVEDEEEVLKLTQQILRMQGYQVFKASCGEDAARMAQEHAQEGIHLLLTDIIMPGMNGYELAQELRSQYPEMKILYMSGYADHTLIHQGMLEEGAGYIQKPFTLESLARKVREVLKEAN